MASGSQDFTGTTHSESLESLTRHGRESFPFQPSQYVCHTSTIPLSTTVDGHFLLKKSRSNVETMFHGYEACSKGSPYCPKQRCMFITANGTRESQRVLANCPCRTITTIEGDPLQPICFTTYLKSINSNLVSRFDDYHQDIKPACVMFCHDSNGVMDNSYSGAMRDFVGISGWGHALSTQKLYKVLGMLYWFRKNHRKYKILKHFENFLSLGRSVAELRRIISQILHTLNGLLVKKFIAFGPELVGYRDLADQTARLFKDLFLDYTKPVVDFDGILHEQPTIYGEIKELLNKCKSSFHLPSREDRISWLETNFQHRSIGSFFGTEFRRLGAYLNGASSTKAEDYSESLAWVFRCTVFCQTRVLGYLPQHVADFKRWSYRNTVSRQVIRLDKSRSQLIYGSVVEFLHDAGIPRALFFANEADHSILKDAIESMSVDIKQTASTDHTVSDGGKIEDARLLINLAREQHWRIPVRDLDDHRIIEYIEIDNFDSEVESWSRPIFWISYQIVVNFFVRRKMWDPSDFSSLPYNGNEYHEDILLAKILHISEPGKERNLTKCKATYAWFLGPAGKLCQSVLANVPEHKAGLELASHDWMHTRRISSESTESGFMYDPSTGRLKDWIFHSFKDWTESTDFISKHVGIALLRGLMDYLGFYRKYKELVSMLILCPQPVEETLIHRVGSYTSLEQTNETVSATWRGAISEGFMMGNPITKTILHLVHASEFQCVKRYLKSLGYHIQRGSSLQELVDRPTLTRDNIVSRQEWTVRSPFIRVRKTAQPGSSSNLFG